MIPVDTAALRARLVAILHEEPEAEAPLHVRVLAALYMNWPDEVAANLLYDAVDSACEAGGLDVDDVLTSIAMIEGPIV